MPVGIDDSVIGHFFLPSVLFRVYGIDNVRSLDNKTSPSTSTEKHGEKTGGRFMKGMESTLLALLFVIFSLLSLITANHGSEEFLAPPQSNQSRVSDLGLRFAFQR
jgi:hypothetical protein